MAAFIADVAASASSPSTWATPPVNSRTKLNHQNTPSFHRSFTYQSSTSGVEVIASLEMVPRKRRRLDDERLEVDEQNCAFCLESLSKSTEPSSIDEKGRRLVARKDKSEIHRTRPDGNTNDANDNETEISYDGNTNCRLNCGHLFHLDCMRSYISHDKCLKCPLCCAICVPNGYGPSPSGRMVVKILHPDEHFRVSGYEESGVIEITYRIPGGVQLSQHPNPGNSFHGTDRVAYLPDSLYVTVPS